MTPEVEIRVCVEAYAAMLPAWFNNEGSLEQRHKWADQMETLRRHAWQCGERNFDDLVRIERLKKNFDPNKARREIAQLKRRQAGMQEHYPTRARNTTREANLGLLQVVIDGLQEQLDMHDELDAAPNSCYDSGA